jgi:hypothetical protein
MGYQQPATAAARPRSGTATALGILAVVLGLLGLVLVVLGAVGLANVATPNMQGFNPGQSVRVGDSGMSVYARSDAAREQTVCTAEGGSGQVVFERPVSAYAVDVAGADFFEVARSPQDLSAGTYQVTCQGTDEPVYAGPSAPTTTASGVTGPLGLGAGAVLLALALALGLAAFLLRRRASAAQPSTAYRLGAHDQTAYTPGYPGAGYPPGGAQPQDYPYGPPAGGQPPYRGQDPYAAPAGPPPPPSGSPYRYVPPVAEPTQPVPYGQGAWAEPPPRPPEQQGEDDVTEPQRQAAPATDDDASAEDDGDARDRPASGLGYGPDEGDEPSSGLGYGPTWTPPGPPR